MVAHWNEEKNTILKATRKVSFEDVLIADILDDIPHFSDKYPHQRLLIVNIRGYIHYVPYVFQEDGSVFYKNIIPSSKLNKKYNS